MKIAQVAPLYESVPPKYYGGTERVVSYLTEELVRMGHEVTLFASADSETRARLVPQCKNSLRMDASVLDPIAYHVLLAEKVFQMADEFDIIHTHVDYFPFSLMRRSSVPSIATMHGRLDLPEIICVFEEFRDIPLVSISLAQRKPIAFANWAGNVHHGLPADLYTYREGKGKYIAFVGRISPEKGVDKAIEIAIKAGITIKIAAKIGAPDRHYFESEIRPLLEHPLVQYIGEIGEAEKNDFMGNAEALIFPIEWPEPFGLVMIEAMACGTPVITRPMGSVPEIVTPGVTGFLFDDTQGAVEAVKRLPEIDRRECRRVFEEKFTARRMAQDYVDVYRKIISEVEDPLKVA